LIAIGEKYQTSLESVENLLVEQVAERAGFTDGYLYRVRKRGSICAIGFYLIYSGLLNLGIKDFSQLARQIGPFGANFKILIYYYSDGRRKLTYLRVRGFGKRSRWFLFK